MYKWSIGIVRKALHEAKYSSVVFYKTGAFSILMGIPVGVCSAVVVTFTSIHWPAGHSDGTPAIQHSVEIGAGHATDSLFLKPLQRPFPMYHYYLNGPIIRGR